MPCDLDLSNGLGHPISSCRVRLFVCSSFQTNSTGPPFSFHHPPGPNQLRVTRHLDSHDRDRVHPSRKVASHGGVDRQRSRTQDDPGSSRRLSALSSPLLLRHFRTWSMQAAEGDGSAGCQEQPPQDCQGPLGAHHCHLCKWLHVRTAAAIGCAATVQRFPIT